MFLAKICVSIGALSRILFPFDALRMKTPNILQNIGMGSIRKVIEKNPLSTMNLMKRIRNHILSQGLVVHSLAVTSTRGREQHCCPVTTLLDVAHVAYDKYGFISDHL